MIAVMVTKVIDAEPSRVFDEVADYHKARARLLGDIATGYEVVEGGSGAGSRVRYRLHVTKKRTRDLDLDVSEIEPDRQLLESDRNSSLTTLWTVEAATGHRSRVTVHTTWVGATGIGGFFERRFAPRGTHRLYTAVLERLAKELAN